MVLIRQDENLQGQHLRWLASLHLSYIKALCPSVFICAQMYAVNQGFVTSEAKGAHDGRRYPTMQILLKQSSEGMKQILLKQFFKNYEAKL